MPKSHSLLLSALGGLHEIDSQGIAHIGALARRRLARLRAEIGEEIGEDVAEIRALLARLAEVERPPSAGARRTAHARAETGPRGGIGLYTYCTCVNTCSVRAVTTALV